MMTARHLTEDERQGLADGTLPAELAHAAAEHVTYCDDCAGDVARLRTLMTRLHTPASITNPGEVDELWPAIRSAIESSKVVSLDAPSAAPADQAAQFPRRKTPWVTIALVAAGLVFLAAVPQLRFLKARATSAMSAIVSVPMDSATPFINVADSSSAYEQEANALLNELQMRRAMMRPQASATLDHDLRSVDQAIAEVKDALVRDPNNPALRRLLASSYRQKVELLKRATNAG
jgi:hypothetical protein